MVAKMFRTKFKIFFFAFFWWEKKNLKVFWHPFGGIFSSFPNDNFHLIKKTVEQAIIETHFKQRKEGKDGRKGVAIAHWMRLHLPSFNPGFKSQAQPIHLKKWANPLFRLFSVFSNKHHFNFYNKYM